MQPFFFILEVFCQRNCGKIPVKQRKKNPMPMHVKSLRAIKAPRATKRLFQQMDGNSCKLCAVLNVHGADVCTRVPQSEADLSGSTLSPILSYHCSFIKHQTQYQHLSDFFFCFPIKAARSYTDQIKDSFIFTLLLSHKLHYT